MYTENYDHILFSTCLFSSSQTLQHVPVQLCVLLHPVNTAYIHMDMVYPLEHKQPTSEHSPLATMPMTPQ